MPFNLIEALASRLTTLSSNIKGHVDLIDNGIDGFLYQFDNTEDFVNKACLIYENKLSVDKSAAYSKYEKYSKKNVFENTLLIVTECLGINDKA